MVNIDQGRPEIDCLTWTENKWRKLSESTGLFVVAIGILIAFSIMFSIPLFSDYYVPPLPKLDKKTLKKMVYD